MIIILLSHSSIKPGKSFSIEFDLSLLSLSRRLFHLQNDEIEEVELTGFDYQHQTLVSTNVISNQYLQVQSFQLNLFREERTHTFLVY